VDLQVALVDDNIRPRPLDQGILADLLSRPHHQQVENVQRPATQLHGSVIPQEDVLTRNEPEWAECEGNVNRFIQHCFVLTPDARLYDDPIACIS
jgi:hypothetical protein